MSRIGAVLFDLDDTLFDHRGAAAAGVGGDVDLWFALEEEHYHRYLAGELGFQEQRRERVRAFATQRGQTVDDPAAWWDAYHARYTAAWTLHPDALPCLSALGDRRAGIVTNGDLAAQTLKVEAVGLGHLPLVASGELGFAKPDPRIYHEACRRLGVPPSATLYAGDRLHTDALGAASAGLRGVWIDRSGTATAAERAEAAASDVPIIRTLDALPALLGRPAAFLRSRAPIGRGAASIRAVGLRSCSVDAEPPPRSPTAAPARSGT